MTGAPPYTATPELGVGLGHRAELHDDIVAHRTEIDWLEIITDHYMGGHDHDVLRALRATFPLVPHSLDMSIGSDSPLDLAYVDEVAAVADAVDAPWVSDHLCFTREEGVALHNLTPVLRTRRKAASVADRVRTVQRRIGRPFLLENITYYVDMPGELSEAAFIGEVLEGCEAGLLLDLNNLAVNAANHRFDPYAFLDELPLERVVQVHLAGNLPDPLGAQVIDGHNAPVGEDVFALLAHLEGRHHLRAAMIERDDHFPDDFGELLAELGHVRGALAAGAAARTPA
ncbi:DUF692 domain-containing protein [Streptomyces sp. NPDC050560]|uniref:DUF692 domain-containing protein n=1 Tax=Streptomyces sp. NPDC050560 TaxID=3365630 RepID=UPI0037AA3F55